MCSPRASYSVSAAQIAQERAAGASWGSLASKYGLPRTSVRRLYQKGLTEIDAGHGRDGGWGKLGSRWRKGNPTASGRSRSGNPCWERCHGEAFSARTETEGPEHGPLSVPRSVERVPRIRPALRRGIDRQGARQKTPHDREVARGPRSILAPLEVGRARDRRVRSPDERERLRTGVPSQAPPICSRLPAVRRESSP